MSTEKLTIPLDPAPEFIFSLKLPPDERLIPGNRDEGKDRPGDAADGEEG